MTGYRIAAFLLIAVLLPASDSSARGKRGKKEAIRKHANTHARALLGLHSQESDQTQGIEQERAENKTYPAVSIEFETARAAAADFDEDSQRHSSKKNGWQLLGPTTGSVPAEVTYTGVATAVSGRITALAVSPQCDASECPIALGAAGGGVWITEDALEAKPHWRSVNAGIPTNSIGSLIFDPTDPKGKTLYAGTGEGNQSADSEAGLGLYRSTNRGRSWSLVPGSFAVSRSVAIAAVEVDPSNADHILMGTNSAVSGGTGVAGGYTFPVPGAPAPALFESTDGGQTFSATFGAAVSQIAIDPQDPATVYIATFNDGVFRRSRRLDGDNTFHLVRAPAGKGERSAIALTVKNGHTRIYEARGGAVNAAGTAIIPADLSRADNGDVAAAALLSGWTVLSKPTRASPGGYASYNFCTGQCWYDIVVATPPGKPDEVWIAGSMQYGEIFTANQPSNGRAVQRSVDAGANFTDMTNDANDLGIHPDQHALVFGGGVTFIGDDGGIMRINGPFVDASAQCDTRGLTPLRLLDCKAWLSAIPSRTDQLNDGLSTLQFNSFSINTASKNTDIMGGTQDNGTWSIAGKTTFESVGGDGGQSGISPRNPRIRMHTYYSRQGDVNFNGTDTMGWDWIFDPVRGEAFSFYIPLIVDAKVEGSWFLGGQHVWRTQDNGGPAAYLDQHCNEFFGDFTVQCGDWEQIGGPTLTGFAYGTDKRTDFGNYVVSLARAAGDNGTLWAATRRGRVFVSSNADAPAASVKFHRIDTADQPNRFISGISVDAANPNHAFVAFSGYSASTAGTPGHVYEATYNSTNGTASWKDISYDIGRLPVTGLALDDNSGDLFAATEFGVLVLEQGDQSWKMAAEGLPPVAVYNLNIDPGNRALYAATHGRGAWKLSLNNQRDNERD